MGFWTDFSDRYWRRWSYRYRSLLNLFPCWETHRSLTERVAEVSDLAAPLLQTSTWLPVRMRAEQPLPHPTGTGQPAAPIAYAGQREIAATARPPCSRQDTSQLAAIGPV